MASDDLSALPAASDDDPESFSTKLAGTVHRHVFLCFKSQSSEADQLSKLLVSAFETRKKDKMKLTVYEIRDGNEFSDGDVLIFPDMIKYRGLKESDVDCFVDDVIMNGKPWASGAQEVLTGSHVFVCAHGGPVLIDKFIEEAELRGLKDQVFVSPCSHIGGHKYAGNLVIYSPDADGKITGQRYGNVAPDDVPELLDGHIGKGQIVERLWRGQMGVSGEEAEKGSEHKLPNGESEKLKDQKLPNGEDSERSKEKLHQKGSQIENTQENFAGCRQGANGISFCSDGSLKPTSEIEEMKQKQITEAPNSDKKRRSDLGLTSPMKNRRIQKQAITGRRQLSFPDKTDDLYEFTTEDLMNTKEGHSTGDVKSGPFLRDDNLSLKGPKLLSAPSKRLGMSYSPDADGKISAHRYGNVAPDDVPELLDDHIGKGQIVERLWRGQMGASDEEAEKGSEHKLPNAITPVIFHIRGQRITLYPVEAPTGEDRIVRREKVFLFNGFPSTEPRVLHIFSDGTYDIVKTAPPCTSSRLELIGHSRGQVCFRNPALKKIYVWDLEQQTVSKMVEDVKESDGEQFSYGFGHKIRGLFMVVRIGLPHHPAQKYVDCYIDTYVEGEQWRRSQIMGTCGFAKGRPATCVSRNHMLYWRASRKTADYILTFDLETEIVGAIKVPDVLVGNIVLGHGFKGQLAAASYVTLTQGVSSHLHIWILMKHAETYYWQRLVHFPSNDLFGEIQELIPLVFFYGKEDRAMNLVIHKNMQEILRIIPAKGEIIPLESSFRGVFLPSPGNRMIWEVGAWREFQATPLGNFQSKTKTGPGTPLGNFQSKKKTGPGTQSQKKVVLCCEDEDS